MNKEKRLELIKRGSEEILTEEDLNYLLDAGIPLRHYIGFEISGKIHLGTGLMSMSKIKDFMDAKIECTVFLADWHTWINDKLSGDLEEIKRIAVNYFKEGMKASLLCWNGDPEKLNFVLGSEHYHKNDSYWQTMIDVAKHTTLGRAQRSITIMGRKEGEAVDFAKLIYPIMQVADIFSLGMNIVHSGIDQRKAHVIARDVATKLKYKPLIYKKEKYKPIAIHHPLLLGLTPPPQWPMEEERKKELFSEMKMSKSIEQSAVFIHDSQDEIRKKIAAAFCPAKEIFFNPILNWAKNIIFRYDGELFVEREKKFGGNISYLDYSSLEKDFEKGTLHPFDLKKAIAEKLIKILEPARKYFEKQRIRKMLEELEELKKS